MGFDVFGAFMNVFIDVVGGVMDEAAVSSACDEMMSMTGNPGQQALIGDHLQEFSEWGMDILEGVTEEGSTFDEFRSMVTNDWYDGDTEKWDGTDIIWYHGWKTVSEQSGYHDSLDDFGEGTGVVFGFGHY